MMTKPISEKSGILGEAEGRDVAQIAVEVVGAGDGLSKDMAVLPIWQEIGDEGYIVLRYEMTKVKYEEVKDTDFLKRVQVFKASAATIVDDGAMSQVEKLINEQAERVAQAKAALDAQTTVQEQIAEDRANKHGDHVLGLHADEKEGLTDGCPDCDDEADRVAAENAAAVS